MIDEKGIFLRYVVGMSFALSAVWLAWSGHLEPFILGLGAISIATVVLICFRLEILDFETVPMWLGIRPWISYAPWLIREIVDANVEVSRRIIAPNLPITPAMIEVKVSQRTDLGRVIHANSITLTPGTVSVDLQGGVIRVHSISQADAEEDVGGEMDRRISDLERALPRPLRKEQ